MMTSRQVVLAGDGEEAEATTLVTDLAAVAMITVVLRSRHRLGLSASDADAADAPWLTAP